jgi:hypothetical protein
MDPEGRVIPIVEGDQGEGFVTPIEDPDNQCRYCGKWLNRHERRRKKNSCLVCEEHKP